MGQFLGEREVCWINEDFHKVPHDEKEALAQTLKVFSDLSAEYPDLRIVAVGATDTAREVVQYDREMANRVAEIKVPLMTSDELHKILVNGGKMVNVNFGAIANDIVTFSTGLPSVCHRLALNACLAANVEVTCSSKFLMKSDNLKEAITRYLNESSDSLKALFDAAMVRERVRKYDNPRLILCALSEGPLEGMYHADILSSIRKTHPDYPSGNVTTYLKRLAGPGKGRVVRSTIGGKYRFAEPMFHSYAQIMLGQPRSNYLTDLVSETIQEMMEDILPIVGRRIRLEFRRQ